MYMDFVRLFNAWLKNDYLMRCKSNDIHHAPYRKI